MLLGNKIRSLRDEQGIMQRQVDLKLTAIETAKDALMDVNC